MALVLADRVRDTTTTTGTGTVTLSGTAPTGYQNFSVIGNANTTYYTINAGSQWEVGIGTYSSTGPTLSRDTVLESSNANALVNFSAGTKDVFVTYPSDRAVTTDGTETLTNKTINGSNNTITNVSLTSAVTGTLPVANGGTGQSSYAVGDILFASTTTALSKLADVATGNALISGGVGVAPAYGKIGLTTHISGTLAVGNGGTGAVTLTTRGVLIGNGTSAVSATAAGITGQVLVGNTGADPSWATLTSTAVTSFSAGTTGLTPSTATQGAITLAGTLAVANGGTGVTTSTGTGNVVLSASPTFTNTVSAANITATGTVTVSGGALNSSGAATVGLTATGAITIGSTSSANAITVGQSTGSQTLNLATGATSSGNTKTVNIGTAGLSGSTTNITIGSAVSGATSTTTLNGTVSIASVIAAPLGSAAAPSYTFTGDTNTGMWSPGADTIAFSEGGVEAMRIDASGNVGIGTSAPLGRLQAVGSAYFGAGPSDATNATLAAYSDGTGISIEAFQGNSSATKRNMWLAAYGGNVGIGTASPGKKLDLVGQFRASGSAASGYALLEYGTSATATNNWHSGSEGDGTFRWYNGSFGAGTERMRITSGGNVGIGETSPGARLHVSGGTVGTTAGNLLNVTIDQGIAGTNAVGVRTNLVRVSSGTDWTTTAMRLQGRVDATDFGYIDFVSGGAQGLAFGSATSERMRIDSSGNVGIGTTSPTSRLTITGGVTEIRDGNYLMLRPTGNGWDMRLQATGTQLDILSGGALGSPIMSLLNGGNVGIGMTAPPQLLAVGNTTDQVGAGVSGAVSTLYFGSPSTGSGGIRRLAYDRATGNFDFIGNSVASPSTQMTITGTGNVGIGTTAPGAKLDVVGVSLTRTDSSGGSTPLIVRNDSSANNTTKSTGLLFQGVDTVGTGKNTGVVQCGPSDANYVTSFLAFQTRTADALNERMRITDAGNVGIGTTAPLARLFVETPTSTGASFAYAANSNGAYPTGVFGGSFGYNFSAGGAEVDFWNGWTGATGNQGGFAFRRQTGASSQNLLMTIRGDGNVGIGTSSPLYQATVLGLGQNTAALTDAGNKGGSLYLQATGVTSGSGGAVLFGTTFGNQTPFAAIKGLVIDGSTNTIGELAFSTRNAIADTALTERLRINSSGNVGIGTSNPGYRLDIASGDTTVGLGYAMRIRSNATATAATLQFTNSAVTTQNGIIACSDTGAMTIQTDGASSLLAFRTNGSERIRVTNGGKVGIGTSSPDATAILDVSSTTAGFLPPRMSTAERDAIGGGAPQEGLILYNVTTDKLQVFSQGAWVNLH